tara:strand:+ start:1575 stop:1802 length:228 start_codon:yes stop_codon:yes gene_type:complete
MFDLNSNILLAFVIGIIFFIIKNLIIRIYKLDQNRQEIVKDTVLLFVVSYVILSCKMLFLPKKDKVEVFTNEPNF